MASLPTTLNISDVPWIQAQAPITSNTLSDSYDFWRSVYCINPPVDSCTYGPCPNPDVTGIGQQVSLYITTACLAILIRYSSSDFRISLYSHLANVYALIYAALGSLARSELTVNDLTFVLVCIASPVTWYLWAAGIFAIFQSQARGRLPTIESKSFAHRYQEYIVTALSLFSLALWITGAIISRRPGKVQLSQPSCKQFWQLDFWGFLLIGPMVLIESMVLYLCIWSVIRLRRKKPKSPAHIHTANERKPMCFTEWIWDLAGHPNQRSAGRRSSKPRSLVKVFLAISQTSPIIMRLLGLSVGLPISELISLIAILLWGYLSIPGLFAPKTRNSRISIAFVLIGEFTLGIGLPYALQFVSFQLQELYMTAFCICWFTTSAALMPLHDELMTFHGGPSLKQAWNLVMQDAHVFEFSWLILGPLSLWIVATVFIDSIWIRPANFTFRTGSFNFDDVLSTRSSTLTFGQLLSIFLTVIPLWSVLELATNKENRQHIKKALWPSPPSIISEEAMENGSEGLQLLQSNSAQVEPSTAV